VRTDDISPHGVEAEISGVEIDTPEDPVDGANVRSMSAKLSPSPWTEAYLGLTYVGKLVPFVFVAFFRSSSLHPAPMDPF